VEDYDYFSISRGVKEVRLQCIPSIHIDRSSNVSPFKFVGKSTIHNQMFIIQMRILSIQNIQQLFISIHILNPTTSEKDTYSLMINSLEHIIFHSKTRQNLTLVHFHKFPTWHLRRRTISNSLLHFSIQQISWFLKHTQCSSYLWFRSETGIQTIHGVQRGIYF